MAKVKFSAFISEIRNKENGSVFSKNRAGNYIRNKVTPVNPQTTFQQAVRMQLGNLSSNWRALTEAQRQSWYAATGSFPYTDIFGDQKQLDGKSLYIKLNQNLANAGSPGIESAPLPVGMPVFALDSATGTVTAGAIDALEVVLLDAPGAAYRIMYYATDVVNPGIQYVKNRYRFIGSNVGTGTTLNLLTVYGNRFGLTAAVGQSIFVKIAVVATATGQLSVPVTAQIILTEPE